MRCVCVFLRRNKANSAMTLIQSNETSDVIVNEDNNAVTTVTPTEEKVVIVERLKRSSTEWVFGLLAILLLCACAVLAAELSLILSKGNKHENILELNQSIESSSLMCMSSNCLRTASVITENGDFKYDPCEDFHQFSCGGFMKKKNVQNKGFFDSLITDAQKKLQDIIKSPVIRNEPKTIEKLKVFYQSCIHTEKIEFLGLRPMQKILDLVGGWPVVLNSKWKYGSFTWQELANKYRIANVSVNFFFEPRIAFDTGPDGLKLSLGLSSANLGLTSITDESKHEEYYQKLVNLAILFGADNETAQREMRYVYYFETVAKHEYWNNFNLNNQRIVKMNISELQNLVPQVDWRTYLSAFLPYIINYKDTIFVDSPVFLPKFAQLLEKTDRRTLANYAAARTIWNLAPLLNQKVRNVVGNNLVPEPRQHYCLDIAMKYFSVPIGAFYLIKYVNSGAKEIVKEITNLIKLAYFVTIDYTNWDYRLKHSIKQKLADVKFFIGYPNELTNFTLIEELYYTLSFNKGEFFENFQKIKKHYFDKSIKYAQHEKSIVNNWDQNGGASIALEVFYLDLTNTLYVPIVMIEEVFQVTEKPMYMNFGSLGVLISKEFAKIIIKSQGIGKDIKDKISCLNKQHKFPSNPDVAKEILNYFTGIEIAQKAYKLWSEKNEIEKPLPGENFTIDQLFWISYANMFCTKLSPFDKDSDLNYLRLTVPLSNVHNFMQDFKCSSNTTEKCDSW
uniref:Peptidase M13 N-terminal domain-containing protein n=1 Tax=Strigamia maritima TaxID=126957 RepID=T1JK12_STRMM